MGQDQKTLNNMPQTSDSETTGPLKLWETPKLKILPVPTRTQGGAVNKNDQDNAYYKKS